MAQRTYVEPLTLEVLEKIIAREKPDALLPTIGGQTGLNLAVKLAEKGVLDKYNVELIGAKIEAIKKAGLERENIQKALFKIQSEGVTGLIQFDEKGNRSGSLIVTPVKNGAPVILEK